MWPSLNKIPTFQDLTLEVTVTVVRPYVVIEPKYGESYRHVSPSVNLKPNFKVTDISSHTQNEAKLGHRLPLNTNRMPYEVPKGI